MDKIFNGTIFRKGCRTSRFPMTPKKEDPTTIKMLDWDFRKPNWEKHMNLAKKYDFEVIMSPDVWNADEVDFRIPQAKELLNHCDRVVIPVHYFDKRLADFELAFPNARWGYKDSVWIWDVKDSITHILGGSPHKQFDRAKYFPNLKSVDGNQIFTNAIKFGKYWDNGVWIRPEGLTTEEIFKLSVEKVNKLWGG